MANTSDDLSTASLATQRFSDFVDLLKQQGNTQTQIAARIAVLPQFLSDVKRGHRPLTELVARRMGEEFDVNFQWLMGTSGKMESPKPQSKSVPTSGSVWLPLFPHPIEGEPRAHPKWGGACVEVAGIAAGKLAQAQHPYVLRFDHDDVEKRLRKGDFVLISQAINEEAPISVVRYRTKSFLARRNEDGSWRRVANKNRLSADSPVTGHCIGVLWSTLL